jgi:hypothetical protein
MQTSQKMVVPQFNENEIIEIDATQLLVLKFRLVKSPQ